MTTLPDIPRLYTALAEVLAAVLVCPGHATAHGQTSLLEHYRRLGGAAGWAFLQLTGDVPLVWWIPCMTAAIGWVYLYL